MTSEELRAFKTQISEPSLERRLSDTTLKEGLCYINNLEIVFTDQRSWGHQSYIRATGFRYKNGKVSDFHYEKEDIDIGVLIGATRDCQYLLDGKFRFYDVKSNLEFKSDIRNISMCAKLYPELLAAKNLSFARYGAEWLKLEQLYEVHKKPALDATINNLKKELTLTKGSTSRNSLLSM